MMKLQSNRRSLILFTWIYLFVFPLFAQHEGMDMSQPESQGQTMKSMEMQGMYGQYNMTRESSGTSWQPESTPSQGINLMQKDWMLMMDGFVNAIYDRQNGKRGDEKTFSNSMFMFMADKPVLTGIFGFRSMLSLDPLMGKNGYPLLFQTGETSNGITPLIDRQHPHDLFMELACTYNIALSEESSVFAYFGVPGEPALGPPAFMHRFSGMSDPKAPITHHWLDSTHITYGVLTAGYIWNNIKMEGSVFRGREPDQYRWNIETPKFDSASARLSFNPVENWSMQVSYGRINSPELSEPNIDVGRTTTSISYNKPYKNANWQTTFAWGRNDNVPGRVLDGFLLESAIGIKDTHIFFTRFERVAKDELFQDGSLLFGEKFNVNKLALGYVYDLPARHRMKWGLGSSIDINIIPDKLKPDYGDTPLGVMIFARAKLE